MLALGLLGLALLSLLIVFSGGLRLMADSAQRSQAAEVGREFLENLRQGPVNLPAGSSRFDGSQPDPVVAGFPPAPYPATRLEGRDYFLRVATDPHPSLGGVIVVEVEVMWEGHRLRFQTFVEP